MYDILARDLGQRALIFRSIRAPDDRVEIAFADINWDGEPEFFLRARSDQLCDGEGCPLLIYSSFDDGPIIELRASYGPVVVTGSEAVGALKSIIHQGPDAPVKQVWNPGAAKYEQTPL